ncbi:MAG: hypothetical protein ACRC51_08000 [Cetobacterium sp.]
MGIILTILIVLITIPLYIGIALYGEVLNYEKRVLNYSLETRVRLSIVWEILNSDLIEKILVQKSRNEKLRYIGKAIFKTEGLRIAGTNKETMIRENILPILTACVVVTLTFSNAKKESKIEERNAIKTPTQESVIKFKF